MIKCNLPILLAERGLKITKLSNDTGISRTTLTALNNNYSQGIQFDTLNKLCSYLKINPGELFLYAPFEINFSFNSDILNFVVLDNKQKWDYDFYCSLDKYKSNMWTFEINDFENLKEEQKKAKEKIWGYLKSLPFPLYKMLEDEILNKINSILEDEEEKSYLNGEYEEEDLENLTINICFTLEEIFNK